MGIQVSVASCVSSPVSSSMQDDCMEGEMSGASELINDARAKVRALVEQQTRLTGSKMAGYHAVASMIGRTPEWLRAFCCNYDHVSLDVTVLNIDAAYQQSRRGHSA